MMIEDEVEFREPRALFIDNIIDIIKIQEAIENNFDVLMLDANETIYDSEGGLSRLMNNTTLVDAFSAARIVLFQHIQEDQRKLITYLHLSTLCHTSQMLDVIHFTYIQ